MSTTKISPTAGKLYDRSFALAFVCNLLFVPANTLLVHYAQWIEYLHTDRERALIELGYITSSGVIISFLARPWLGQMVNRFGAAIYRRGHRDIGNGTSEDACDAQADDSAGNIKKRVYIGDEEVGEEAYEEKYIAGQPHVF